MAELLVRPAAVADAPAIASVHRLSRAEYYGVPPQADDRETMWNHFLGQPERATYVAVERDTIVGFMSAVHRTSSSELTSIYVLPNHYGRGIGSRLYQKFQLERDDGLPGFLEVWAGNRRAVDFYLHRGWIPTSESRPGPQGVDFVGYRLPLGDLNSPVG